MLSQFSKIKITSNVTKWETYSLIITDHLTLFDEEKDIITDLSIVKVYKKATIILAEGRLQAIVTLFTTVHQLIKN